MKINGASGADEDTFSGWFELERIYVAVCSTKRNLIAILLKKIN